jgi:hypothetical protein
MGALSVGLLAACSTQSGAGAASPETAVQAQALSIRSDATGVLRGRLVFVGGPFPGSPRPLGGTVTVTGHSRVVITVGRDGRYTVTLPVGTYRLAGSSPWFGSGADRCHAQSPVRVVSKRPAHADVVCQGR